MCIVDVIVLVELQLAQFADGNITRSHSVDFGMALILEVVVHPLEFLLLQNNAPLSSSSELQYMLLDTYFQLISESDYIPQQPRQYDSSAILVVQVYIF